MDPVVNGHFTARIGPAFYESKLFWHTPFAIHASQIFQYAKCIFICTMVKCLETEPLECHYVRPAHFLSPTRPTIWMLTRCKHYGKLWRQRERRNQLVIDGWLPITKIPQTALWWFPWSYPGDKPISESMKKLVDWGIYSPLGFNESTLMWRHCYGIAHHPHSSQGLFSLQSYE